MKDNKFTAKDVLDKFGENTTCYLTGRPINLNDAKSYHFDHIIPTSRGGGNDIDNLGICCKEANMAKSSMTVDEFIALCREIITHHDS